MKVSIVKHWLLMLALSFMFVPGVFAQSQKVSLQLKNATLSQFFKAVEAQTSYNFSYLENIVDHKKDITMSVKDVTLASALNKALEGRNLKYEVVSDKSIIITEKTAAKDVPVKVSGQVFDELGEPAIGCSVMQKGTGNGVVTDANGAYTITVPRGAVLVVSYIGYTTQEVAVGNKTNININLTEDAESLAEVVLVGYGSQRRQAVSGAVVQADLEKFKDVPENDVMVKLKGSVPGLNIEGGHAKAGDDVTLSVRGQNTITSSGNTPLVVVDGAIYYGSIKDISPYDIENVTVLKDASAAAVYGSRSANGVILIETKRGAGTKDGKPVFNFDINYGLSNEYKRPHIYNGEEYLQRVLDIRELKGQEADPSKITSYLTPLEAENYYSTPDHRATIEDPYGVVAQAAWNRSVNASVANSSDKTHYYIATSFIDQHGVVKGDQYKRLSARVNIDSDITRWFNISIKANYSHRNEGGEKLVNLNYKYYLSPYGSLYNDDGSINLYPNGSKTVDNVLKMYYSEYVNNTDNMDAVVSARIKCPWIEGLTVTSTMSNNLKWYQYGLFEDHTTYEAANSYGKGSIKRQYTYNILWDNILKYNRSFGKHNIDFTGLFSQEKYSFDSITGSASNFANDQLMLGNLGLGSTQKIGSEMKASEAIGLMARLTYTYADRYSITGTFRRDGYSAFGVDSKYGNFPSVGVNWAISREPFMEDVDFISNLAIRATYGSNGNQSVSPYSTLGKLSNGKIAYLGDTEYRNTQYIDTMGNGLLGWETTTGANLGLDFGFVGDRISGSIDVYNTNTNGMLFKEQLPVLSGFASIKSNIGQINNKGIELGLHALNIDKEFKWMTDFSFSLNRQKLIHTQTDEDDIDEKLFMGKPVNVIYGFDVIGIWQETDEIPNGWEVGDYKVRDVDGNGLLEKDKDYTIIGYADPNFRWGLTNTFKYKGFTLMVFVNSIWGGKCKDGRWFASQECKFQGNNYEHGTDSNFLVWDTWTPHNTDAYFCKITMSNNSERAYPLEDRSFIKLEKVSLSYDLSKYVRPWGIKGLGVSISGDNLGGWAPYYHGLDAEGDQGVHAYTNPLLRTWTMSLNMNF